MIKKWACFVLVLMLALPLAQSLAEDTSRNSDSLRYSYVDAVSASLRISGSTATCFGMGRGKNPNTTTHLMVTLQKKASGAASWSGIKSWSTSVSGTSTATIEETYTVASGYSYRVKVRCRIKDSSGNTLETVYKYSTVISH